MTGSAVTIPEPGTASGIVDEPMTTAAAFEAKLIGVFETVMAEPGTRVWDPMT